MKACSKFIVTLIAALFFVSLNSFSQGAEFRDSDDRETPPAPDYSNMHSWASHPFKHDFGDSIPKPLRKSYSYDSTIDVFFIHPTTYIQKAGNKMNGDINNESLNSRTDRRT